MLNKEIGDKLKQMVNEGLTAKEMAKEMKWPLAIAYWHLSAMGLKAKRTEGSLADIQSKQPKIESLVSKGRTVNQIAKSLGWRYQRTWNALRFFGLTARKKKALSDKQEERIRKLAGDGKTMKQISKRLKVNYAYVSRFLHANQIPFVRGSELRQRKDLEEIYERYQSGESVMVLANEAGVTRQRIHQIVQKLAKRKGEKLREHRYDLHGGRGERVHVPDELLNMVAEGKLSARQAGRLQGFSDVMISNRLRKRGISLAKQRIEKADARNADIYRRFMAGELACDLSQEYQISMGNFWQKLIRHRRKTGAKPKSRIGGWDHDPRRNGSRTHSAARSGNR